VNGCDLLINATGRVTGKGQVQVPKEIRDALNISTGDELLFELASDKTFLVHVRNRRRLSELAGILTPKQPFLGIEEEEEATKRMVAKQAAQRLQHE
jgi:AbrB family looped-hinge helix DNA binding protein